MSSLLTILMLLLVFASVAMLFAEGMWSNAIRLINIVTAALVATNFFEPMARLLEEYLPSSGTYYADFLALWLLFILTMAILTSITDQVSRVKVRFLKIVDQIGGSFFALWVGWVMVCFTMMTLHTAPLAPIFCFEGFQPQERMVMGMGPDRQWLGYMQSASLGPFSRLATPDEWQREQFVFDRQGEFIPKYNARRVAYEKEAKAAAAKAN